MHMDIVLPVGRILIAVIFLISSFAKLSDREGTRKGLQDFGVSKVFLPYFVTLLPLAEVVTTILLIPLATAWWGALGALILFSIFTAAIARNLWLGKTPTCNCFGQLQKKPISWKTVVRNIIMLLIAAGLVWYGRKNPGLSIWAWRDGLTFLEQIAVVALVLNVTLVIGISWVLFLLWHQQGRLLTRLEIVEVANSVSTNKPVFNGHRPVTGRAIGSTMPDFNLVDFSGRSIEQDELLSPGKSLLLLFIDLNCGPCNAFLPTVSHWQQTMAADLRILLISRGDGKENLAKVSVYNLDHFFLQKDQHLSKLFGVEVTPSAVLVHPDGRIASMVTTGAEAITALVGQFAGTAGVKPTIINARNFDVQLSTSKAQNAQSVGQLAPQLNLSDLNGRLATLEDFRGRNTLIIFWDPACSFCAQMLPQLQAWEIFSPPDAPQILIVSAGTADSNRGMRLKAKVVIDNEFALAQQFGVSGTPSGVLLDANGLIASPIIVGASAIFELLRKK